MTLLLVKIAAVEGLVYVFYVNLLGTFSCDADTFPVPPFPLPLAAARAAAL